ncbi:MAG: 6-phosphofructokinase, partial [Clostridiales bacterium]|nr:6-phosphofructokinase [Clostridiales bacterium]
PAPTRDTTQPHERCAGIEVPGHRAGNLALYVGIATGATAVLVPEEPWDFEVDVAEKIRAARLAGRTNFMVVVAEGAKRKADGSLDNEVVGNGSAGQQVADMIRAELGLDPRVTVLGHIQRGGAPSARDRVTATRMGYFAVETLANGKTNRVIVHQHGGITDIDMEEGLKQQNTLNEDERTVLKAMTGAV